ncbi:hypothetical protein J5X84_22610 [Streptosporangiaceae bacterium NEAU-GS5]|nr:hypothetical protein [Streptosporangiaceae bacterium NEAU-GS5]
MMCVLRRDLSGEPSATRRSPWPATARFHADGGASVGGVPLAELARRFGTPAYVVDEADSRVVVDNLGEIARLASMVPFGHRQKVLLRVVPSVEAGEHEAIRTGGEDRQFGLSIASGDAAAAVIRVLRQPELELVGLHCHIGSQIRMAGPYEQAARVMVDDLAWIRETAGVELPELNLGGGHGIAYLETDDALDPLTLATAITGAVKERCAELGLAVPRLAVEPGRAISGPAGLTLYRVISVKHHANGTFVAVDGGMADNPRPALYGARYTLALVGHPASALPRPVGL